MMLIDGEDDVYFFDRDNNVFKVKGIRFVHKKNLQRHLRATLIDGVSGFRIFCVRTSRNAIDFLRVKRVSVFLL